jgi:N-acetylneuraminic acid mutarotase
VGRCLPLLFITAAACGRYGFGDAPHDPDACALQITTGATRINYNTHRTLETAGGRAPLQFTATPSAPNVVASIDTTGTLITRDEPGTVTVDVTDADGCTASRDFTVGGDTLFYVGGSTSSGPSAQVFRSTDGTTWSVAGTLPDKRVYGALIVFRDRLWWFAGSDSTATVRDDIYVSDDGATWTVAGHVPTAASSFGFTIYNDQLYFVGGNNNLGRVYRSDNALDWTQIGSLPQDNHGGSLVALSNQLIYAGGHNGTLFNWVLASPDGVTWTQVGTLAIAREYHSGIRVDDRMYIAGGQDTTPTSLTSVTSTLDGTTWTPAPALPAPRAFGALLRWSDQFWSFGGTDGGGVFTASPGASWTSVGSSFPIPRQGGGIAAFTPSS